MGWYRMKKNTKSSFLKSLSNRKVYINLGLYDFRCGIDSLAATSSATCPKAFDDGALFVYCSKSRKQIRMVFWEGCGVWMISRRLARGILKWPNKNSDRTHILACYDDLMALLQDPVSENELRRRKVANKLSKAGR